MPSITFTSCTPRFLAFSTGKPLLQPPRHPREFVEGLTFTRAVSETTDADDEVQRVPRAPARGRGRG